MRKMQEEILKYLLTVPKGKVVTYGQIAEFLGNKNLSRAVGNALHRNPDGDKYPCYKVVNRRASCQRIMLSAKLRSRKSVLKKTASR